MTTTRTVASWATTARTRPTPPPQRLLSRRRRQQHLLPPLRRRSPPLPAKSLATVATLDAKITHFSTLCYFTTFHFSPSPLTRDQHTARCSVFHNNNLCSWTVHILEALAVYICDIMTSFSTPAAVQTCKILSMYSVASVFIRKLCTSFSNILAGF